MTKQDKIKEGIAEFCRVLRVEGQLHHYTPQTDADDILEFLHSQGVALKVERELPSNPHNFTDREQRLHLYECSDKCHKAEQEAIREAGFAAVEPLIIVKGNKQSHTV